MVAIVEGGESNLVLSPFIVGPTKTAKDARGRVIHVSLVLPTSRKFGETWGIPLLNSVGMPQVSLLLRDLGI